MDSSKSASISIEPVTDEAELPLLATIFDVALKYTDSFHEVITRCTPNTPYDGALLSLKTAFRDPDHYIFKAVVKEDNNGIERVVGVSHWSVGYISIPKVDPFASVSNGLATATEENFTVPITTIESPEQTAFEEARRKGRNAYISTIRGKKHVYLHRIATMPEYQRRGIASRLLQFGADLADREGLYAWLHGRPVAIKMYEKAGWRPVVTSEFNIPGIETGPVTSMVRMPLTSREKSVARTL